jgi:allantoinase
MTRADLLLTDALIHLPSARAEGWISVRDGMIDDIGTTAPAPPARVVQDCGGRWVMPGLVDVHVHFRDPGATEKEDFVSGSAAAAAGGVTTVIDMPNTGALVLSPEDVRTKLAAIAGRSNVDYGLHALLADSAPYARELAEMGVAGLKWLMGYEEIDGRPAQPSSRRALRDALRASADAGLLVGVHAEDAGWIGELSNEIRNAGNVEPVAHGRSRPPFVEAVAVAEAAILAAEWGVRLHVHHLSSALGLRVLDALRAATGRPFTAETCPHYLTLTEDDLKRLGTAGKVNPPLRTSDDGAALWDGLVDGRIECVASDHAPHTPEQKSKRSIWEALSGLIGVETLFTVLFTQVRRGRISVERFIDAAAAAPARLVGLAHRKGVLEPGFDADLLIVDADAKATIDPRSLHSRHRQSVFAGSEAIGRIDSVFLRGQRIVQQGRPEGPPRGMHVPSRNGQRTTARREG